MFIQINLFLEHELKKPLAIYFSEKGGKEEKKS